MTQQIGELLVIGLIILGAVLVLRNKKYYKQQQDHDQKNANKAE